ncbi:MAG: alpha/beta fold hydrolase [Hyphomonadaceae bacterium]|jgi:pimeloyl-ACP methyl ester carboxylesterase
MNGQAKHSVTRRAAFTQLVGPVALVAAPGLASAAAPAVQTARKKTFVLVHGTWHGGWVWRQVAERLQAQGHRVLTPTATGCGERAHLIGPDTNLSTHVQDICAAIEAEDAEEVILIGHSFGGLTITGVADRLGERIAHIVFYDAFIPTRTRPAWVMPEADGSWPKWWKDRQAHFIHGYKMNFFDHYPIKMLVPEEDVVNVALLKRKLTWHPAGQWTEPVSFTNGGWEDRPRTYIHTTLQTFAPSSPAMWGPGRGAGWRWIDVPTARDGMLTHPDVVAACFASLG